MVIAQYRVDDKRAVVADIVARHQRRAAATANATRPAWSNAAMPVSKPPSRNVAPVHPVRGSGAKRPLRSG